MPFISLASVVEFFTFHIQQLDCSFDILNKKNETSSTALPSLFMGIFRFIYLFLWHHGPCVPWGWCVRSASMVEDALKMPTHQSWTESKWCTATCCITSNPTATTCLRTLFSLSCFFFCIFTSNLKLILLTCFLVMCWRVQQKKTKTPSLCLRHHFLVELVQRSL